MLCADCEEFAGGTGRKHLLGPPFRCAATAENGLGVQRIPACHPGGRDLPYQQKLSPDGTRRIRDFVKQGGSYLGLCAGAYFGAQEIVFEKGGDLEVCARRDLAFFPGKAVGPAYGTGRFRYDSDADIEAAPITWRGENEEILCHAFFYGGCFFENPAIYPHIRILATYGDLPGTPAAAVYCPIEKGKAVLSGVHLEYSVRDWTGFSDAGHLRIRPLLLASEERRRRCFCSLLNLLEINNDKSVKNILL